MNNSRYPFSWPIVSLGDICHINKSSLSEKTSKDYKFKYIDLSSVDEGKIEFPTEDISFGEAPSRARRKINKNDIIMSTVRPNLKGFAFIDFDSTNFICSTGFAVLTAKEHAYNRYIYQLLYSKNIETQINNMLVGSNYPAINSSDVASLKIALPPLAEQEKIAGILGTWDEAIEKLSSLIEQMKLLKKGLMQRLLTGKTHLPGFTQPWKEVKLGEILVERNEYTTQNNQVTILTSSRKGIFRQEDYFDKQVASENNIGYKILHKYDFTYRAMTDDDVYCFNQLTNEDMGAVSPAYSVFYCENVPNLLIKEILNSKCFGHQLLKISQGGTRKSLKFSALKTLKIYIPSDINEQQAIADVLSAADEEIDLLNKKLEALKEQKKGLMQQLLTGQTRVKVN